MLWRVKGQIAKDRLSLVAAGVAFYGLLSLFPALGAIISIYGLVFDSQQVMQQIQTLEGLFPPAAMEMVVGQLQGLTQAGGTALGLGAVVGLLLALWSASAAIRSLMKALNVAYDEREKRSFLKRTGIALGLTLGAIVGSAVAIAAVVLLPAIVRALGLGSVAAGIIAYARWPVLGLAAVFVFGMLYRYAPSRDPVHWEWLTWGAIIAAALWLGGSALFSWYVSNFGKYNETYGGVAAVVILLLWLLLSAYAILIGAEFNGELAHKARNSPTSRSATQLPNESKEASSKAPQ